MYLTNDDLAKILPVVQNAVRSLITNEDDAQDAVQDTLTRLYTVAHCLPADAKRLKSIAYATARNIVFDHFRAYKRTCRYRDYSFVVDTIAENSCQDDGYAMQPLVSAQAQPECDLFLLNQLKQVIDQLPRLQKQALVLHAHGFSYQEIAERQGSCIGTIRSRLHSARKQSRRLLAAYIQAA